MGNLYLVRHGQASFGADDYDQLSPKGREQGLRLGQYWREKAQSLGQHQASPFDAVLIGTLKRHRQTWEAMAEGAGWEHTPHIWPGLDEYDSHALIETIPPEPLAKPDSPEMYRHHFRLLRDALQSWMAGKTQPKGMPSYADFVVGVTSALDLVRQQHTGQVLIVSSGGPISTAVGHILGTPAETMIELNLRIRNTSITEFAFTPKRHMLVTYNTLPHLDSAEHAPWITYA
jgi:broad specificity phosphatase PhoE